MLEKKIKFKEFLKNYRQFLWTFFPNNPELFQLKTQGFKNS